MKHRWGIRALIILTALAICYGMTRMYRTKEEERKQEKTALGLTIWYTVRDCPKASMELILEQCREETGLRIEATAFEDEEALGAAFDADRPDLLYCSHLRAEKLQKQQHLGSLSADSPMAAVPADIVRWAARSFIPAGSRVPLLIINTQKTADSFDSMEELCAAAGNEPFLVSDDWAETLFSLMYAKEEGMTGSDKDLKNRLFQTVYNMLAEAVFRGGFVTVEERAAEYVTQGMVPCAIARSSELSGLEGKDIRVQLIPTLEGVPTRLPAELMGFAVMDGADQEAADSFAKWLDAGENRGRAALRAGAVPISAGIDAQSTLESSLLKISQSGRLAYLSEDTEFYENRVDFEARLHEMLSQVA